MDFRKEKNPLISGFEWNGAILDWINERFKKFLSTKYPIFERFADENEEKTELTYNVSYCAIIW